MQNTFTAKKKVTTAFLMVSVLLLILVPSTGHAQINAQGMGGVLLKCSGVKLTIKQAAKKAEEQTAVETKDKATTKLEDKETCQDAIAYYAITQLLAKLTQSTLNWINGGFRGDPSFLQNPQAHITSIATQKRTELLSVLGSDPQAFPYGRAAMRAMIDREIAKGTAGLRRRATYTLNSHVPTGDAADFHADFRIGGWDAFMAQSIQQQNNPVGFALLASEEEARVTAGSEDNEIETTKRELDQNGGFLGNKICKESHHESGRYDPPDPSSPNPDEASWIAVANNTSLPDPLREDARMHICKTWVTKTPGSVIAHALNKTIIDVPLDGVIAADEINESLNVVFSALMNKAFQNGVANLKDGAAFLQEEANEVNLGSIGLGDLLFDPVGTLGEGLGEATEYFGGIGVNADDTETAQGDLTGWFEQGGSFDIFNQLPYIIYLQNRYLGNPIDLPEGIDQDTGEPFVDPTPGFNGIIDQNSALTETIIELEHLDVCLPGPNPNYKEKIFQRIQTAEAEIRTALGSLQELQDMLDLTGAAAGSSTEVAETSIQRLYHVGEDLIQKIELAYGRFPFPENAPFIKEVAETELIKINGYLETIEENKTKAIGLNITLRNLDFIMRRIQALNDQLDAGNLTQEMAESQGASLISMFYNMAPNAVKAEDLVELKSIANVATGNIEYINTLTDECYTQINDPSFTGKRGQVGYTSIMGNTLYAEGQNHVNHFLSPGMNLDWGIDDDAWGTVNAVFQQIGFFSTGGLFGSMETSTVFVSLDAVGVAGFDNFNRGSNWFEDWTDIQ
jgi:hypothetical protein